MRNERWPNLFVVGAAKCGTTSLHAYLAAHPAVFMSQRKEPHHFSRLRTTPELEPRLRQILDDGKYLELFADAGEVTWIGESSTSYLWDPNAHERIRAACPDARVIIMLRDPIQRALSHYVNNVREQSELRPFAEAVREELRTGSWDWIRSYVRNGRYLDSVRLYYDAFPGRVYVGFAEDLADDTSAEMERIFGFLGLDSQMVPAEAYQPRLNSSGFARGPVWRYLLRTRFRRVMWKVAPRSARRVARRVAIRSEAKPELEPEALQELTRALRGQERPLERLLGRPVSWEPLGSVDTNDSLEHAGHRT